MNEKPEDVEDIAEKAAQDAAAEAYDREYNEVYPAAKAEADALEEFQPIAAQGKLSPDALKKAKAAKAEEIAEKKAQEFSNKVYIAVHAAVYKVALDLLEGTSLN